MRYVFEYTARETVEAASEEARGWLGSYIYVADGWELIDVRTAEPVAHRLGTTQEKA